MTIRAGIMGGTGYMGGEALRILLDHPDVDLQWISTRQPGELAEFHPNLYGESVNMVHPDDITPCDVVFLALPTETSLHATSRFLESQCRVIDLGAAFRLKDRQLWEAVYGLSHDRWDLAQQAVYGLSEIHEEAIRSARLIANPGCFSSATILALAPLVTAGLIDLAHIVVDGLSGTAGAGAETTRAAHHPEIGNNLVPYNVVDHRHSYEMEQELGRLAGVDLNIHFTPTYVPITRGILAIIHCFPLISLSRDTVFDCLQAFYARAPFVQVFDLPKEQTASWQYKPYPWVSAIAGTNYCYIGFDIDEKRNRLVLFSVLDSIGKGGAQAGIENMNLMFDLPRTAGLDRRGLHPN